PAPSGGGLRGGLDVPRGEERRGGVLLLTALVAGGVRRSNRTNVAIVSLTLVSLGAFVVFGWLSVEAGTLGARLGPKAWREALAPPTDLLHGTALMFVAYTGYGRIATLGEEMREPGRNIPRAIIATLALSLLLYVSVAA